MTHIELHKPFHVVGCLVVHAVVHHEPEQDVQLRELRKRCCVQRWCNTRPKRETTDDVAELDTHGEPRQACHCAVAVGQTETEKRIEQRRAATNHVVTHPIRRSARVPQPGINAHTCGWENQQTLGEQTHKRERR